MGVAVESLWAAVEKPGRSSEETEVAGSSGVEVGAVVVVAMDVGAVAVVAMDVAAVAAAFVDFAAEVAAVLPRQPFFSALLGLLGSHPALRSSFFDSERMLWSFDPTLEQIPPFSLLPLPAKQSCPSTERTLCAAQLAWEL